MKSPQNLFPSKGSLIVTVAFVLCVSSQLSASIDVFQVIPTSTNVVDAQLTIDNPSCNNKPSSIIIITPVTIAGGGSSFSDACGVSYDAAGKKWHIVDEAENPIPTNGKILFNVRVETPNAKAFVLDATPQNSEGDWTTITGHPGVNKSNSVLLFTHNATIGVPQTNNQGVWAYKTSSNTPFIWSVYNENQSPALAASYHIANVSAANLTNKLSSFVVTSSSSNVGFGLLALTNNFLNNNSNAIVFVTHNYNPGSNLSGQYHEHPIGVIYFSSTWCILNEDNTSISTNGVSFNVEAFSGPMKLK